MPAAAHVTAARVRHRTARVLATPPPIHLSHLEHYHARIHPITAVPPAQRARLLPSPARQLLDHRPAPSAASRPRAVGRQRQDGPAREQKLVVQAIAQLAKIRPYLPGTPCPGVRSGRMPAITVNTDAPARHDWPRFTTKGDESG